ncbi:MULTISPECIES: phospho-N-acetylmuramoyl-pentapeptide-transferase [unclassified Halanaerobium]|uniref:phospho-N-acetylmuramoyl-pentapeptide- transferase n=1 Tax=unclassified Halanaerobium TaxID=2641197 RepID=UPI000DF30318|nr:MULTISPECIES: phospho-N-acetylmuramoyl-pentapeptide-transferase [unclassified Halanaerobium]RCW51379.1 phospho-N-acetylmuramoyl-pentapeptide-transferase [Halanaerobium sp. MA284_MarDTE_T2]RCW81422.1 phospho-N-acetylmuramoyl-pentapeptide-transferase [Halanaerobium sp. DL-01]
MVYITAFLIPLFLMLCFGNPFISLLKKINFGQQIREFGPKNHLKKSGIPTMGGVLILLIFVFSLLLFAELNLKIAVVLVSSLIMAAAGFMDDFLKIKLSRSLGLTAVQKIGLQFISALVVIIYLYFRAEPYYVLIPFVGSYSIPFYLTAVLSFFTIIGAANAVNLTDGLDGLAAGTTLVVSLTFAVIFFSFSNDYFTVMMLILAGSCLGFLWFNGNPAQVFMGDVGSLAIGGILGTAAVITGTEFYLLTAGGVYVAETVSVMIQVPYFKLTGGKRVFKMTPIHHHFELAGTAENKVVIRFIIVNVILSLLTIYSLYV